VLIEALNEDERRDLVNYGTRRRSKRALCGAQNTGKLNLYEE